jgi:hypothetical protein
MTYEDFHDKLDEILNHFKKVNERDMITIKELIQYIDKRLLKQTNKKTLRVAKTNTSISFANRNLSKIKPRRTLTSLKGLF